MIYFFYAAIFLITLTFIIHFICHFILTIQTSNKESKNYGWGTIFTFKELYKSKNFVHGYAATYNCINKTCSNDYINNENRFRFNDIYILLDPLSFVLVKLFCWQKWIREKIPTAKYIREKIPTTNFFKTYSRIEAEKVLDKLTQ